MDGFYQDEDYLLGLAGQSNGSAQLSLRGRSDEVVGHGQGYDETSGTPNWLLFTITLGVLFLAAFTLKTFAFVAYRAMNGLSPTSCISERAFDVVVSEARKRANVSQAATTPTVTAESSPPPIVFQSYDEDYYIKYEDRGKTRSGLVKIRLKNNGIDGYYIGGMCADADGCATITEGHVSYSGDAWWVQEILEEDEERCGLRVFSRGAFDFPANTFAGRWVANTGTRGNYLKFKRNSFSITSSGAPGGDFPVSTAVPKQAILISSQHDSV